MEGIDPMVYVTKQNVKVYFVNIQRLSFTLKCEI